MADKNLSLTNEPITVWFWGHSFIRRLEQFCIQYYEDHGNMGLVPESHLVYFKSHSGAKVTDCRRDLKIIKQVEAEMVFLDIGSNDLDTPDPQPHLLAREVVAIAHHILDTYEDVKVVVICEILFRSIHSRYPLTNPNFVCDAHRYNNMIKILIEKLSETYRNGIQFCHHRGLVENWSSFLEDGVHLNLEGMRKYQKSLRRAILCHSPWVRQKRQLDRAKD